MNIITEIQKILYFYSLHFWAKEHSLNNILEWEAFSLHTFDITMLICVKKLGFCHFFYNISLFVILMWNFFKFLFNHL
jgi:hypothetical protein